MKTLTFNNVYNVRIMCAARCHIQQISYFSINECRPDSIKISSLVLTRIQMKVNVFILYTKTLILSVFIACNHFGVPPSTCCICIRSKTS